MTKKAARQLADGTDEQDNALYKGKHDRALLLPTMVRYLPRPQGKIVADEFASISHQDSTIPEETATELCTMLQDIADTEVYLPACDCTD